MCNLTGTFSNPVDTTIQANDTACADGAGAQNIAQGVGTVAWTGLNSGTNYFYKIFPYSNSAADIDYKIDTIPATANATTTSVVDLSITQTDGVTSATPGGNVTYTIVASNAGPSNDSSVTLIDTFPADLTCTYTSVAAGESYRKYSGGFW